MPLPGIAQSKRRRSRHLNPEPRTLNQMEAKLKEPILGVTENLIPSVFHAIVTLSVPAGHLPLEGKATIREYHPLNRRHTTLVNLSAPQVLSSRAQPRDLYCTAAICTYAPPLKRHLGASFFAFPSLTIYRSARRIPLLRPS